MPRVTQHSDPVVAKLERLGLDVQYEPEAARFDATEGLFWFCNDTYAGQGDPLYSILSTLRFSPSRMSRGPDSDGGQMVYEALEDGSLDPQELMAWIEAVSYTHLGNKYQDRPLRFVDPLFVKAGDSIIWMLKPTMFNPGAEGIAPPSSASGGVVNNFQAIVVNMLMWGDVYKRQPFPVI